MQNLDNPQHPLWATIRFIAVCVGVTFVLWRNASSFDETEIKTVVEIAIMAGGYEGVMAWAKGGLKKKPVLQTEE